MAPFFDEYYIWPFPISARSLTHYIHMRAGKEPSGAEVSQELISSLTRRTNGGARIAKEARREIAPQETIAPSEPPICHVAHISHVSGRHKMSRSKKISKKKRDKRHLVLFLLEERERAPWLRGGPMCRG